MDRRGWEKTKTGKVIYPRPFHRWSNKDVARILFSVVIDKWGYAFTFFQMLDILINVVDLIYKKYQSGVVNDLLSALYSLILTDKEELSEPDPTIYIPDTHQVDYDELYKERLYNIKE